MNAGLPKHVMHVFAQEELGVEQTLLAAYEALTKNQVQEARRRAKSALFAVRERGDDLGEAKSLECIAHCDRVLQRTRRCSEASRRAARLYERLGDARGESSALNLFSHSCMLLGRTDEALEAALLSVQLSQSERPMPEAVYAYNSLGMAYAWSGHFEKASNCLDIAVGLASSCDPPVSPYQPKLNQVFVEAIRLCAARAAAQAMPSLQPMNYLIRQCRRMERSGECLDYSPGMLPAAGVVSSTMKSLHAAWQGELDIAERYVERARRLLGEGVTWLDACVHWAVGEIAWARSDFGVAEAALSEMKASAMHVEHEKLACHAHQLLAQVYESQGKIELALAELKALRHREQRMVTESVASRESIARWQIGARRSEQHLEHALLASRQFERWSLEDPLTGIANRRAFERELSARLSGAMPAGRSVSVAMIDINQFKSVNDSFSHQVGDRALQAVARILVDSVRDTDIAARLAGDEFVVLFSDSDPLAVADIVTRIQTAVGAYDWQGIAPGLRISVSIGVGHAVEGDTVASIMHRSDQSMYACKPGWGATGY